MKKLIPIFLLLVLATGCAHQKGFNYAAHQQMNKRLALTNQIKHGGKDFLASRCPHAKTGNTGYRFLNLLRKKNKGPRKPSPCFTQ